MYNPNMGLLPNFKAPWFGKLKVAWLSEPKIALYCVYFAAVAGTGQPMILFLSGLQTVPGDVLEAATIDGAGKIKGFFYITVPMLKETFVVVLATLIIAAMKVYDIIKVMTGGGPGNATETLATYMYSQTFMYNNFGKGSAIASAMFLMMIFIIVPYVIYTAKED
ncbi:MAG: carbohydrate ABC transporter permease [Eisenbergiella sp.]